MITVRELLKMNNASTVLKFSDESFHFIPVFGARSFNKHNFNMMPSHQITNEGYYHFSSSFGAHSLVENVEELNNRLINHYSHYDDKHIASIKHYTNESSDLNYYLERQHFKPESITQQDKDRYQQHSDNLIKAISKHTTPEHLSVYSGIRASPEHFIKPHGDKGALIQTTHFLSTSISKHIASKFSGPDANSVHNERNGRGNVHAPHHMLKIEIPQGTRAAYVEHHSASPNEKELILNPNSKLQFHHIPTNENINGRDHVIWHAKLINEENHEHN